MDKRAQGADVRFLKAFENAYGTVPTSAEADWLQMRIGDWNLGESAGLVEEEVLGLGRRHVEVFQSGPRTEGSARVPLDEVSAGHWLKAAWGDPTTTGDGPYDHVWIGGENDPLSFACEIGHTRVNPAKYRRQGGCMIDTLKTERGGSTGQAWLDLGIKAQSEASFALSVDGLADNTDAVSPKPFHRRTGLATLNGGDVAQITDWTIETSNNLEEFEGANRTDGRLSGFDPGRFVCSGSVTVRFGQDTTLDGIADGIATAALVFQFTGQGGTNFLKFEVPAAKLERPSVPINGPGGIQVTYNWIAEDDPTTGHSLKVTLKNDKDAY